MKDKASNRSSKDLVFAPSFSHKGPQIFQALRIAITDALGFQPTFARLARIIGQETNLTHYWFKVLPHQHLIGFLCLLERLPEPKRIEFLRKYCRELPRLDHPRLAHDPIVVGNLEALLHKDRGLTWIQGGADYQRTWLVSAFAHSFPVVCGDKATVGGLDIHEPRRFVPVENIVYLKEPLPLYAVKTQIKDAWPLVMSARARLMLFNGVWSAMPELQDDILRLASDQHVIVTVDRIPAMDTKSSGLITHSLTVAPVKESEQLIRLKLEAT